MPLPESRAARTQRRTVERAARKQAQREHEAARTAANGGRPPVMLILKRLLRRPVVLLILVCATVLAITVPMARLEQQRRYNATELAAFARRHQDVAAKVAQSAHPAISRALADAMGDCVTHYPPSQSAQARRGEGAVGLGVEAQCVEGLVVTISRSQGTNLGLATSSELARLGFVAANLSPDARDAYLSQVHPVRVRWVLQTHEQGQELDLQSSPWRSPSS